MSEALTVEPPSGCRLDVFSEKELEHHMARIALLRERVTGVRAEPGTVTIGFDLPADDDRLIGFVASERRCCQFLSVELGADTRGATVTYSSDDPLAKDALFSAARLFDPAGPADTRMAGSRRTVAKAAGPIGIIGLACAAACALPVLVTAGGVGAIAGGLAGWGWVAIGIGALAVAAGVAVRWRRRAAAPDAGCSC